MGLLLRGDERLTIDSSVQVYFCDRHSLWRRGANENANGLLCQNIAKGADLSVPSGSVTTPVQLALYRGRAWLGGKDWK